MVEQEFPQGEQEKDDLVKELIDLSVRIVSWMVTLTASQMVRIFPDLSPDDITEGGFIANITFETCLVAFSNEHKDLSAKQKWLLVLLGLVILSADTFDGSLARARIRGGLPHDTARGLILDTERDRQTIVFYELATIVREFFSEKDTNKRKAVIMLAMSLLATDPGPSLFNAYIKSQGKTEPKQGGKGALAFPGTQIYRAIKNVIEGVFPRLHIFGKEIPTVFITGTLGLFGNVYQMRARLKIAKNENYPVTLDKKTQEAAAESFELLKKIAAVTIPLGLSLGAFLIWLSNEENDEHSLLN